MLPKSVSNAAPDLRLNEAYNMGILTDPMQIRERVEYETPVCPLCKERVPLKQWNAHQAQHHASSPVRIDATPNEFPMGAISANDLAQPRLGLDNEAVQRYAEAIKDGAVLPPVVLFYDAASESYFLADGFHRRAAYRLLGRTTINVVIHIGTLRDAVLYSVGANAEHGLPRSNDDKRRAVMRLLTDPEWAQWSDNKIAKACHVHHSTVGEYRKSILRNPQDSAPDAAQPAPSMTAPAAPKFPAPSLPAPRLVTRNGTTYPMNTSAIGSKPSAAPRTQYRNDEFSQRAPDDVPMVDEDADYGDLPPYDETPELPPAVAKQPSPLAPLPQGEGNGWARPLPAPVPQVEQASEAERAAALAARQALMTAQPSAALDALGERDYWPDVMTLREALLEILAQMVFLYGAPEESRNNIRDICNKALSATDHR